MLDLDNNDPNGTVGASTLSDWITNGYNKYLDLGQYFSDPGAKFNNSQIQGALQARYNSDLLFPVYDQLINQGSNAEYHIIGWAGFHLTDAQASGTSGTLTGYFTQVIWQGIVSSPALRRPQSPTSGSIPSPHRLTRKRSVMTYRVRNIAVAVGLALIAALLTTFYVANYKRHVRQSESTVTVYVAKHDIPQGTSGADLMKHGLIASQDVVQRTVVPGAISNPDQVQALLTRQDIYTGEQITLRRFAGHAEQGVRVQLHGTLRAISIPGTADELLTGTLKDGDHVDVLANLKTGDCSTCFAVRDVARDVLVLQASATPNGAKVSNTESSVMLAVSENREAQKIFFAVQNSAGWSLQLRPVANASDSPEDIEGIQSVLKDGASSAAITHYLNGRLK